MAKCKNTGSICLSLLGCIYLMEQKRGYSIKKTQKMSSKEKIQTWAKRAERRTKWCLLWWTPQVLTLLFLLSDIIQLILCVLLLVFQMNLLSVKKFLSFCFLSELFSCYYCLFSCRFIWQSMKLGRVMIDCLLSLLFFSPSFLREEWFLSVSWLTNHFPSIIHVLGVKVSGEEVKTEMNSFSSFASVSLAKENQANADQAAQTLSFDIILFIWRMM